MFAVAFVYLIIFTTLTNCRYNNNNNNNDDNDDYLTKIINSLNVGVKLATKLINFDEKNDVITSFILNKLNRGRYNKYVSITLLLSSWRKIIYKGCEFFFFSVIPGR